MAKVDYIDPVYALHGTMGKTGKSNKLVFKQLAATGTNFTAPKPVLAERQYTADEIARQNRFAAARSAMEVALADPTTAAELKAEFRAQRKYKTLRGYVFSVKYAEAGQ